MNRVTARIALIAYMLGGWLLPATHHHGSSCDHTHAGVCDSQHAGHSAEAVLTLSSAEHHHHCDHDHGACSSSHGSHQRDAGQKLVDQELTGAATIVYSGTTLNCDGLCALCVASTLSSTRSDRLHHAVLTGTATGSHRLLDLNLSLPSVPSSYSPRGPPQDLV